MGTAKDGSADERSTNERPANERPADERSADEIGRRTGRTDSAERAAFRPAPGQHTAMT
jgi:hypothetical protein